MSNYPLHALRALLAARAPTRGVIVRVSGSQVRVATAQGLQTASASSQMIVGQTVALRHGAAYPAAVAGRVYAL